MSAYGWKPSLPDIRDHVHSFAAAELPETVDLRTTGHLPAVWDQGQLGACVPHGTDAAYGYDLMAQNPGLVDWDGSKLFIYYIGRTIEGTVSSDSGLTIADGIKALNSAGSPPIADWPYDISRYTEKPPAQAYTDAKLREAVKYARVPQDAPSMKACLAAGTPIVIGFTVYDSFESDAVAANGIVPMPAHSEQVLGGHCMLVVGYLDIAGVPYFICRNSWGSSWGDKGYCYMPQAYLTSPSLADDFWTVQSVSSPDPSPVPPTPKPVPPPSPGPPPPVPAPSPRSFFAVVWAWIRSLFV